MSYWVEVGPNSITGVYKRMKFGHRDTEHADRRMQHKDTGEGWSDASREPGSTQDCQPPAQTREEAWSRSSPQPSEGAGPCQGLDFGLRVSRTEREQVCCF